MFQETRLPALVAELGSETGMAKLPRGTAVRLGRETDLVRTRGLLEGLRCPRS